jgi:cell division protease FtsH
MADGMGLERGLSGDTARRPGAAVRALVEEVFGRATDLLAERRSLLDDGAAEPLAQGTLTEVELRP